MKITHVSAIPIRIPLPTAPYATENAGTRIDWHGRRSRTSSVRPDPALDYALVRIETDEGVTGIGEAQADIGFFGNSLEELCAAIDLYLGPQLLGRDPFDREHLLDLLDYRENSCARSGIDLALHDLMGRALGVPVSTLLGGAHRRRIQVAIEVAGGAPQDMAARCTSLVARGVRVFKPKIGGHVEADVERLSAIREAVGPEVILRADANQGYNAKDAIRLCRLAEQAGVGLDLLEQPVAAWDLAGMALVRASVDTPIEADESCYTVHDAIQIVRHGAADVLNVKLAKAGGLYTAKKIAAIAEAAGLRCVIGTSFGLGVEVAAKLHLAASTMHIVDAVEFTELVVHEPLIEQPASGPLALPLRDGCLDVPTGPGLGVELAAEDVDRLRAWS
ncbi:MAG TPA: enolase C-terminal domain-like protein [Gaiellaceae bacterium]|nr:enolase C-terminal domain-like protein [Gaiellaceae bacterium]